MSWNYRWSAVPRIWIPPESQRGIVCSKNLTSTGAQWNLLELKKAGVITHEAVALHKFAPNQSLPVMPWQYSLDIRLQMGYLIGLAFDLTEMNKVACIKLLHWVKSVLFFAFHHGYSLLSEASFQNTWRAKVVVERRCYPALGFSF